MNQKELELAKKRYNILLNEKKQLQQKKDKILELEKNPIIQEYLNLTSEIKSKEEKLDESCVILSAFSQSASRTKESNKLLVNIGGYCCDNVLGIRKVTINKAKYIRYIDLETDEVYDIEPDKKDEFEQQNKIIYLNNGNRDLFSLKMIKELRIEFFKELLIKEQDQVINEMLKKNKQMTKKR